MGTEPHYPRNPRLCNINRKTQKETIMTQFERILEAVRAVPQFKGADTADKMRARLRVHANYLLARKAMASLRGVGKRSMANFLAVYGLQETVTVMDLQKD
jgi:hypothetical protein